MSTTLETLPRIQHGQIAGHPVGVLRWDENDSWTSGKKWVSGNKVEKLAWQTDIASTLGYTHFVTMGGPWSNHLHAIGALCHHHNWGLNPIVRGEASASPSPTLCDLQHWGFPIYYCDRTRYRALRDQPLQRREALLNYESKNKNTWDKTRRDDEATPRQIRTALDQHQALSAFLYQLPSTLHDQWYRDLVQDVQHSISHHSSWWIREGGDHALAVLSVAAWTQHIAQYLHDRNEHFDTWIVSMGTGSTFKGILLGLSLCHTPYPIQLIGVPTVCNIPSLTQDIARFEQINTTNHTNPRIAWTLWQDTQWGGYAKYPASLAAQHPVLEASLGTPLDRVYTLKSAAALAKRLAEKSLRSARPLLIHTGGLQGNRIQAQST